MAIDLARDEGGAVPRHIGIIMDGNGRWATRRGLPRLAGHRAGVENIRRVITACVEEGVRYLTLYAFSTENWTRPAPEVAGLVRLLDEFIERELAELHAEGVQLRHLGRLDRLPPALRAKVERAVELTRANSRLTVACAFDYGGRAEIVEAVRAIVADGIAPEAVDERLLARYLFTRDLPDPDLIIRTSGEWRLSNFLIWQAAYAEYWSTPVCWPDFGVEELRQALHGYARRERRFGAVMPASPRPRVAALR